MLQSNLHNAIPSYVKFALVSATTVNINSVSVEISLSKAAQKLILYDFFQFYSQTETLYRKCGHWTVKNYQQWFVLDQRGALNTQPTNPVNRTLHVYRVAQ